MKKLIEIPKAIIIVSPFIIQESSLNKAYANITDIQMNTSYSILKDRENYYQRFPYLFVNPANNYIYFVNNTNKKTNS